MLLEPEALRNRAFADTVTLSTPLRQEMQREISELHFDAEVLKRARDERSRQSSLAAATSPRVALVPPDRRAVQSCVYAFFWCSYSSVGGGPYGLSGDDEGTKSASGSLARILAILSAHSSRSNVIMPPSPNVVMFFDDWKLKQPMWPRAPAGRPK